MESGVQQGDSISIFYDPMIAKLVVWGKDRDQAIQKLKFALDGYKILGLPTNIPFLKRVLNEPEFSKGDYDTNFIVENEHNLLKKTSIEYSDLAKGVLGKLVQHALKIPKELFNFRTNYNLKEKYQVKVSGEHLKESQVYTVEVLNQGNHTFSVEIFESDQLVYT